MACPCSREACWSNPGFLSSFCRCLAGKESNPSNPNILSHKYFYHDGGRHGKTFFTKSTKRPSCTKVGAWLRARRQSHQSHPRDCALRGAFDVASVGSWSTGDRRPPARDGVGVSTKNRAANSSTTKGEKRNRLLVIAKGDDSRSCPRAPRGSRTGGSWRLAERYPDACIFVGGNQRGA